MTSWADQTESFQVHKKQKNDFEAWKKAMADKKGVECTEKQSLPELDRVCEVRQGCPNRAEKMCQMCPQRRQACIPHWNKQTRRCAVCDPALPGDEEKKPEFTKKKDRRRVIESSFSLQNFDELVIENPDFAEDSQMY